MQDKTKTLAVIGLVVILPTFILWFSVLLYYGFHQKYLADRFFDILPEIGGGIIMIIFPVLALVLNTYLLAGMKKSILNRIINLISLIFILIFIVSLFWG